MANYSKKELSRCLSGHLDMLGFDHKRIRERIHANNRSSRAKDISTKRILQTDEIEKIFVGSQREGIGFGHFNDLDILQINHGIICMKTRGRISHNGKLVFKMVENKAPAGYTFLKLISKENSSEMFEQIKYALVKEKRGKFLSSQLFMTKNDDVFKMGNGFISKNTHYKTPQGPSIPKYVEDDLKNYYLSQMKLEDHEMDFVRAFPCQAHGILKTWEKRDRKCGWPSQKTIAHVMTLPSYVVPVGQKGSINKDLQWRICFTMAETHLVQDFNNTQTKVFVLMKLIAKYILQPLCKDISSYIMKTIMLWLAEKIPQKKFRRKHLIARLNDALKYLKTAVEKRCLPSYMNPKKNLFANRLQKQQQNTIIVRLNFFILHGCKMIADYFCNRHAQEKEIKRVCEKIYAANIVDKLQTCQMALFTTRQLADYFHRMFLMSARWQMILYNILFHLGPFFFNYGTQVFSDPLSYDLSRKFAQTEKEEITALKHESNIKRELAVTVHGSKWNAGFVERNEQPFVKLVCLLFYPVIFVTVFLIKTQLLFPAQMVRAVNSNPIL